MVYPNNLPLMDPGFTDPEARTRTSIDLHVTGSTQVGTWNAELVANTKDGEEDAAAPSGMPASNTRDSNTSW